MAAKSEMSTKKGPPLKNNCTYGSKTKTKLCFVNHCFNSSLMTPDKHFIYVKRGPRRQAWLDAGKVKVERSMKTNMYCCQDHFDLNTDFDNDFHEAIKLGLSPRLKADVLPHLNMNRKPPKFCNETIRNKPMYPVRTSGLLSQSPNLVVASDIPPPTLVLLPPEELTETPLRFPEHFPACDYLPLPQGGKNSPPDQVCRSKVKKQNILPSASSANLAAGLSGVQFFLFNSDKEVVPSEPQPLNPGPPLFANPLATRFHVPIAQKPDQSYVKFRCKRTIATLKNIPTTALNPVSQDWMTNIKSVKEKKENEYEKKNIKINELNIWDLKDEHKQKFLNKLDCYLETGIQLTPQYLQQSFKRFINEDNELSLHKLKFNKENWFQQLLSEHKDIASKLENPNFSIELTINQLALVAHFSTLKFLYKHFFSGNSVCAHPERIYALDEYIIRIPSYSKPCKIDVTRRDITPEEMSGSKIVTLVVGANTFGHKVSPVLILQGGGLRPSFKKNFPKDWRIVTSPSGRLTSYYFQFWIEHFATTKPNGRMILLLNYEMRKYLVNPSSELLQVLEESEISLHFLHRSDKHELNPLGYDVYEKFEALVQDHMEEFSSEHPNCTAVTPDNLGHIISPAWEALDPTTLSDSYKRAGVFPLNPAAFLMESDCNSDSSSDSAEPSLKVVRTSVARSYVCRRRKTTPPSTSQGGSQLPSPLISQAKDCVVVQPSTSKSCIVERDSILPALQPATISGSTINDVAREPSLSLDVQEVSQTHEDPSRPRFEQVYMEVAAIKQEPMEAEDCMQPYWHHPSGIDLDLASLDSQTLEINFRTCETENLGFPISKTYFESNKPKLDYTDEPEFQNALIPQVKLEITENEIISLELNLSDNK